MSATVLLLIAVVIGSASCRSTGDTPIAASASRDGALQVVGPFDITSLDPLRSGYVFTRMGITETVLEADDDGSPQPGLAATWSVSADGLAWRFDLRDHARFHDGRNVTPADVIRALERARVDPGALALAPVRRITADGNSVIVELAEPFGPLPALMAHSTVQVLSPASFDAGGSVRSIVGTGPYRIVMLEPPLKFEVARFDGWTGTPPAVDRATYLSVGRAETRALLAESGQADLVFGLDPASLVRLRAREFPAIVAITIPRSISLKMNAGHRWLADVRVREAISLAIDRAGIARAILRDPEMAATQLFPPTLRGWHSMALAPLRTDPARARELLADLGWTRGPRGMLVRDGEPFELTLRTFPDRPELPVVAAAIQEELRQVGIGVTVQIGNSGDVPLGHRDGSLELALVARSYTIVPDPIGTLLQDFGSTGGDWGAMRWSSPDVVAALHELIVTTPGPARRDALRARISAVLQMELPIIPIAWYRQTAAVSARVTGASLDPLERSYRITRLTWASLPAPAR